MLLPWRVITPVLLLGIAFVSNALLHALNQFADSSAPSREAMVIESIGKYYAPFRFDYLSGWSGLLRRSVHVPVLPETAKQSKVGDHVDVVVGKGLFKKPWVFPRDKHLEYDNPGFKALYLGAFSFGLAVCTSVYLLSYKRRYLYAQGIRLYFLALAFGAAAFYLT